MTAEKLLVDLVDACTWPSEAYWRWFELAALREVRLEEPILELGCGDGALTSLLGLHVEEGIDLNPRAVDRAAARTEVYDRVRCMDIRSLEAEGDEGRFATIFTNSVLEHVPDVSGVARACRNLLRPGGRLVATMPLVDMNRHLLISSERYAEFRRRQLQHHNLWSARDWRAALLDAGFAQVEVLPYFSGEDCEHWDRLDALGTLGKGRYRIATGVRKLASVATSAGVKRRVKERVAHGLARRMRGSTGAANDPCCGLFIAEKSAAG